jgi:propionate catabolism operon transcriptional regulator
VEQGVLTGAVISCQDPISIQRVDRHIRTRIKPHAPDGSGTRYELGQFLGESAAVQHIQRMALSCARSQATVLLIGESGTGKELIAQGIHMASDRRDMPFVAVNCAAVSETLLESELFGYEEGAFTGARRGGKVGLFEAAHNGTLFLDEVGEMPVSLQTRLLRVLQEREVLRVGATEPTPVNVRVIAATHRDLMDQVERGLFRLDLYYRLNILRLDVPPLRERIDDIAPMARALQRKLCQRLGLNAAATQPLLDVLMAQAPRYSWPGNVRELENLIERLVAYAGADKVDPAQAEAFVRAAAPELFGEHAGGVSPCGYGHTASQPASSSGLLARAQRGAVPLAGWPDADSAVGAGSARGASGAGRAVSEDMLPPRGQRLKARQAQAERDEIQLVLAACAGDKAEAAQRLGISRTTLWRKLKASG